MKTFEIHFSTDQTGYVRINANDEDEARELFEEGEFGESEPIYFNGGMDIDSIKELDNR